MYYMLYRPSSLIGKTLISCINKENSNFSSGFLYILCIYNIFILNFYGKYINIYQKEISLIGRATVLHTEG